MKKLSIYMSSEPTYPMEVWELQDGKAVCTHSRHGQPLYGSIEGVTPENGKEYLDLLLNRVDYATFLHAKVEN